MQKLVQGIHHVQAAIFSSQRELFDRLAREQRPEVLFITCSDSRINPNLIPQTDPGELFILRNAGNIIPPYGAGHGGAAATIEFAIVALGVKDVVVCGHSECGAMIVPAPNASPSSGGGAVPPPLPSQAGAGPPPPAP